MFAIGQLTDQTSWLTLSVNKSLLGLKARVSVGVLPADRVGRRPTRHADCASPPPPKGSMGDRQGAVLRLVRPARRHLGQRGELVGLHRLGRGRAADQGVLRLLVRRPREGDLRAARAAGAELPPGQPRGADRDTVVAARRDLPRRARARHAAARDDAGAVGAARRPPAAIEPGAATETALATTPLGPDGAVHPDRRATDDAGHADRGIRRGPRWRR